MMNLFDGSLSAGVHRIGFNAEALPAGLYLMRLKSPNGVSIGKVTLIK